MGVRIWGAARGCHGACCGCCVAPGATTDRARARGLPPLQRSRPPSRAVWPFAYGFLYTPLSPIEDQARLLPSFTIVTTAGPAAPLASVPVAPSLRPPDESLRVLQSTHVIRDPRVRSEGVSAIAGPGRLRRAVVPRECSARLDEWRGPVLPPRGLIAMCPPLFPVSDICISYHTMSDVRCPMPDARYPIDPRSWPNGR